MSSRSMEGVNSAVRSRSSARWINPSIGGSTAFHEFEQLGEERHKRLHLDGIAFEHNRIAAYRDTRIERLFDYVEQAIAGSHHERHVHG